MLYKGVRKKMCPHIRKQAIKDRLCPLIMGGLITLAVVVKGQKKERRPD